MLNVPFPYEDWDKNPKVSKMILNSQWHQQRFNEVTKEMSFSFLVSFVVTLIMITPFWYTGCKIDILHSLYNISFSLSNQHEAQVSDEDNWT